MVGDQCTKYGTQLYQPPLPLKTHITVPKERLDEGQDK